MTTKPHDALFKAAFGTPKHASALLRSVLPPALVDAIAWDTLEPKPGSFVDPDLSERHCDLLFSAQHQHEQIWLYLLLEHQSLTLADMSFRMLDYLVRIWRRHRSDSDDPMPLILPLVISHAPGGWTAPRQFHDIIVPHPSSIPGAAEFVPKFEFLVVDLAHLSNEELKARSLAAFPTLALWVFRDARDARKLLSELQHWLGTFREVLQAPSGIEAVAHVLRYISLVCEGLHYEQFRETIRKQLPEAERAAMTIAEELRQEGRQEGQISLLERLLTLKFGDLPGEYKARIEAASAELVERYAARILTADSLAAVFVEQS